jgi:hypothetical protein
MRRPSKPRRYTSSTFDSPRESQRILRFIPSQTVEFVDLPRIAFERAKHEAEAKAKKKAARAKKKVAWERERMLGAKWEERERLARIMRRNRWLNGAQEPLMIEVKRGGRRIVRKQPGAPPAQS